MKQPSAKQVKQWTEGIKKNGGVTIKLRRLLDAFGYARRGSNTMDQIGAALRKQALHLDAAVQVKSLDDVVTLRGNAVERIGDIYRDAKGRRGPERQFKVEYGDTLLKKLKVKPLRDSEQRIVGKEYSPFGTRDAVDYLCTNNDERLVVVEIKIDDGEKRGVEQLLRYLDLVYNDANLEPYRKTYPRAILVTGQGDLATRSALRTLDPLGLIDWYVYGLEGNVLRTKKLDVERSVPAICPECGTKLAGKKAN